VSTRGDFEPLVDEATFYRVQAVLDGRVVVAGPRNRNHPDFLLRGFVRCERCGRPLTGSWSKGRSGHYAYYHCQRQCRAVNISKATLEGAFVDELALLQPTPGYMRLVKDRILCVWEQRRAEAKDRTTEQQRRVSAIQQKLDKLDEAFLYSEAIDVTTYGRQRDKLREELTLAKIDHHSEASEGSGARSVKPSGWIRPRTPSSGCCRRRFSSPYATWTRGSHCNRAQRSDVAGLSGWRRLRD